VQRDGVRRAVRIARYARKPIVIHTREAWTDTIALLSKHWTDAASRNHALLLRALRSGRALASILSGFRGIITFPMIEFRKPRAAPPPIESAGD